MDLSGRAHILQTGMVFEMGPGALCLERVKAEHLLICEDTLVLVSGRRRGLRDPRLLLVLCSYKAVIDWIFHPPSIRLLPCDYHHFSSYLNLHYLTLKSIPH